MYGAITSETIDINLMRMLIGDVKHKTLPVFSVQYYPESAPGPHDSEYLFERFIELMNESAARA